MNTEKSSQLKMQTYGEARIVSNRNAREKYGIMESSRNNEREGLENNRREIAIIQDSDSKVKQNSVYESGSDDNPRRSKVPRISEGDQLDDVKQMYAEDLDKRILMTELTSPALMEAWTDMQNFHLDRMRNETITYFEAGLSGISIDEYISATENQLNGNVNMENFQDEVRGRVREALIGMGENSLADDLFQ